MKDGKFGINFNCNIFLGGPNNKPQDMEDRTTSHGVENYIHRVRVFVYGFI